MTASNAATISFRWSTASGFSSLAMTGTRRPILSMTRCTGSMSCGDRTNESATKSTPSSRANSRSAMSLADNAGTDTFTPGSESPLLSETGPPTTTRQTTSGPSIAMTSNAIRPSSIRNRSPALASSASSEYVVDTRSWVPIHGSTVIRTSSPTFQIVEPSANRPSLIFGPCRSAMIPIVRPVSSAAFRTRSKFAAWSACSPWLKLRRATSMPQLASSLIRSSLAVAGPSVQTIRVLRNV